MLGCTVRYPAGWQERQATPLYVLEPTLGKPYGVWPYNWETADGRKIDIDYTPPVPTTSFRGGAERLRCHDTPAGPAVPETRFGCWIEESADTSFQFWLAPNRGCEEGLDLQWRNECWVGSLMVSGREITMTPGTHGRWLDFTYVTWVERDGHLVLAADFNPLHGHDGARFFGGAPTLARADPTADRLLLLTMAVEYWQRWGARSL